MPSDLCLKCEHHKVCMKDKNLIGDFYVPPNPLYFSLEYRKKSFEKFQERERAGFPCDDYLPTIVRCKECEHGKLGCPEDLVCDYWDSDGLDSNDFCSHGERREECTKVQFN